MAWAAEVFEDRVYAGYWRVEKLDSDDDGGIDVTLFSGPDAENRAKEYSTWKYGSK